MSAKKVVAIILSTTLIALLAFCITWAVINFDAIKYAMSGTALYTKEDLDAAYEDGYNTAGLNNQDLQTQITSLRKQLDAKTKEYNDANKDYLDAQSALEKKAEELEKANAKVSELSNNASSLESSLAQAQTDLATAQSNYSKALSDYQTAINRVDELEQEVSNLNTTIKSYEDFKESVESTETVVATFEYNGAVILMQQYTSGATITGVDVPEDTDEIKFNGWTVDSQPVDLNNYVITQSTTFVADLTKTTYYTVTFYVDGEVYDTQKIVAGATFDIPEEPTKDGFEFNGWTVNGQVVDLDSYIVSENVSFVADYTSFITYSISFMVDDSVYNFQTVISGSSIILPDNPSKEGFEFKGWSTDGKTIIVVPVDNIVSSATYIAVFQEMTIETLSAGLYDYDTLELTKSWDNLLNDGDVYFNASTNSLSCSEIIPTTYPSKDQKTLKGLLILPNNILVIEDYCFARQVELKKIIISSGLVLDKYAFYGCTSLEEVILPNTIESIYDRCFSGCTSLSKINVPSSLLFVGKGFLSGTLVSEVVFPSNLRYVRYTGGSLEETYVSTPFTGSNLSYLSTSTYYNSVSAYSFQNCSNLKNLVITSNVKDLSYSIYTLRAYLKSNNHLNIFYEGTSNSWDKVTKYFDSVDPDSIDPGYSNLCSFSVYFYSETIPVSSGLYWHYVDGIATPW